MGYKVSYKPSGVDIDYIDLAGSLTKPDMDELVKIGKVDRIQMREIPSEKDMIALNEQYYSLFQGTGFRIYSTHSETDLSFFRFLPNLEKVTIDYVYDDVRNLEALSLLPKLKILDLHTFQAKDDFAFLSGISDKLEQLNIETKSAALDLAMLARFRNLKKLYISRYKKNIEVLSGLPALESLRLSGVSVKSLAFINGIRNLKSLMIHRGSTTDFSELYGNSTIEAMQIFRVSNLDNAEIIAQLPNLTAVELSWLRHIAHLPDLSRHRRLKHISLDDMKGLTDFAALERCESLESVSFSVCPSALEPEDILPVLRNSSVKQCRFFTSSEKKNSRIKELIQEFGKINTSNFMAVRKMLFPFSDF